MRACTVVRGNKNTYALKEYELKPIPADTAAAALKNFLKDNGIFPERVILGIPRSQISARQLRFPTHHDAEIKRMVGYEINNLFPFKQEELVYDYAIINKEPHGYSKVLLIAAQREIISKYISLLTKAGLVPAAIEISALSLFNQFCEQKRPLLNYLFAYIDTTYIDILHISNQKLTFTRGIHFSEPPDIETACNAIASTVTILRDKGSVVESAALAGSACDSAQFAARLKELLGCPIETDKAITVSRGLLRKNNFHPLTINLLPQGFRDEREKHRKKKVLFAFAVLLLLNLSLAWNSVFLKVKSLRQYLKELTSQIKSADLQTHAAQAAILNMQILKRYHASSALTLSLFAQIYRLAPEDTAITLLDIRGEKEAGAIIITGQARNSETVLQFANSLKTTGLINKAEVNYITRKNPPLEGLVNFELKAAF